MLAKIWKKALLVICIIACLYNVMHKLVSRTSLEIQLKSVENQTSLMDIFKENKTDSEQENEKIDVYRNEVKQEESRENDTIVIIN